MSSIVIRPGTIADLPHIRAIYDYYSTKVTDAAVTFDVAPRSDDFMAGWFAKFTSAGPYFLRVAEREGQILGYAYSGPFRPKPAYDTSVECSVYLAPNATGQCVGARLYSVLLSELRKAGVHRAYGWLALPNPASEALHEQMGFKRVCLLDEVGRKFDRYWDVALFENTEIGDCP